VRHFILYPYPMVLISHKHELIFIKTMKTAGTSIEESLEFHLLGTPPHGFGEETKERIGHDFYVSSRSLGFNSDFMRNHTSCQKLVQLLGHERFSRYQKVSCVRNPWDQVVSYFWWKLRNRTFLLTLGGKMPMFMLKIWFSAWYLTNQTRIRKLSFTQQLGVGGTVPSMHLIRYESIESDLRELLEKIGHSEQELWIPKRKGLVRNRKEPFQRYYFQLVRESLARHRFQDLANFGYKWVDESQLL
jgi:hypothetical protein